MKKFFLLLAVLFLFGCRKEENKSEYYNADGSLLTWEQARDLTEELWSAFDFAAVSREILPSSTRIPQSHMQKPYYSPAYDSWVVVMSPNPLGIDGFQFYHYVFVNAKTGTIYIDPVEREFDNEMIKWHSVKLPQLPSNTARFHSSARTKAMTTKIRPNSGNDKWAIIINGGGIKESNYVRYWNHCSALYNILVD